MIIVDYSLRNIWHLFAKNVDIFAKLEKNWQSYRSSRAFDYSERKNGYIRKGQISRGKTSKQGILQRIKGIHLAMGNEDQNIAVMERKMSNADQ